MADVQIVQNRSDSYGTDAQFDQPRSRYLHTATALVDAHNRQPEGSRP
jgi:hypothetical protein